jgi:hypothetical protein
MVSTESKTNVAAVMEGKLKEKLESMGIGFLCLAQGTAIPILSICKGLKRDASFWYML